MIGREVAVAVAERFGTPLYAYDLDDVDARCAELRRVLPSHAQLFYSLKANPLPALGAAACRAGCRAEISSEGELTAAIAAGFEPTAMLFTGPAKRERDLRRALAVGVGCFSAESWRDLERIDAAAREAMTTARVILRVNPATAPRAQLAMTGVASQFGFEEDDLAATGPRRAALANVDVAGIHVYLGTQLPDAGALGEAFRVGIATAEASADDFAVAVVDLGGGFPWPYATTGPGPDLSPLASSLAELDRARERTAGAELWFESGRYVAASAGTLLARIVDVKRSRGTTYVVLDAGISHLGGMPGLGRVLRPAVSLVAVEHEGGGTPIVADVVGPLCTPLDCLARGATVEHAEPGALVAVPNAGSYGATASLTAFLSQPAALEVSLRGERVVDVARLRSGHEPLPHTTGDAHAHELLAVSRAVPAGLA